MNFTNLHNFEKYQYYCVPPKSGIEKFLKSQDPIVITGKLQFPKQNESINLITFGDWSKTEEGNFTLKYLENKVNSIDAIVFLGDQGYDMYQEDGKIGNDFLKFVKSVTSRIPYQVI